MITETNDFTASRLSESIALELESSLRRIGYKVKIAEGEEAAPLIEKTADAYGKTVEKILKNVYTSKRSGGFEYDIGPEVKALGKIFSADLVVLAAMTARSKSNASWQQNFKDAAAQAAVFGTAPLFTRSSVDLHVAVVDARTGKISWFNTRSSHTLFKDGTTPAATRRLVAETFRPYMK